MIDFTNKPRLILLVMIPLGCLVTIIFTFLPVYVNLLLCWSFARLFTTIGKMSIIKILVYYWPDYIMGTVLAISCISNNIGEALSKVILPYINDGVGGWKGMFYVSVVISTIIALPTFIWVRDGKTEFVDQEESISKETSDAFSGDDKFDSKTGNSMESLSVETATTPTGKFLLRSLLALFVNPRMILLMISNNAISCLCEIFGSWSINFLKDSLNISNSTSGALTGIFCAASAIGTMIGIYHS